MTNQTTNNHSKNIKLNYRLLAIVGSIICIIIIVAIIIVAVINRNNDQNQSPSSDQSFLETTDTKFVTAMETPTTLSNGKTNKYSPIATYLIYYHDKDSITKMQTVYEYLDAETAKKNYDIMQSRAQISDSIPDLDSNFIIITMDEERYNTLSFSDIEKSNEPYDGSKPVVQIEDTGDDDENSTKESDALIYHDSGIDE